MTSIKIDPSNSVTLANALLKETCTRLGFSADEIFDSLKKDFLQTVIIKHVYSLTEKPEENAKLSGAIAMWNQYKNSPTTVRSYLETFKPYLRTDVVKYLDKHAEELQKFIDYRRDFDNTYFAAGTLIGTYLSKTKYEDEPVEIPQFAWLRIAVGLFHNRRTANGMDSLDWIKIIYDNLSKKKAIFGSPIIFNVGFKDGAPASCIILVVGDSLDDIYDVMKEAAMASKNNAGIGCDFSLLRHSQIGRHGKSKGIVPLLKIWDDSTDYVNQGSKRKGAGTVSNRSHHYDLPEMLQLIDSTSENPLKHIDISIMISDLFIDRVEKDEQWTLFCPKQTSKLNDLHGKRFSEEYVKYEKKAEIWNRYKKYSLLRKLHREKELTGETLIKYRTLQAEFEGKPLPEIIESRKFSAYDLFYNICELQCKESKPYITNGCNINRKNNMDNVGPVRSPNLCQEVMIPAVPGKETGCCNLSSISMKAFASSKGFDYLDFAKTCREQIVGLNAVVDHTDNVSDKVKKSNDENRPVGLGVTGLGSAMYVMGIPFVDMKKLPKKKNGEYVYVDIAKEAPDYDDEALLERVVNPDAMEFMWKAWSCMYYNSLLSSMEEAKIHGPYKNFWTSHTAKGELQYHLWQMEEKETGRSYPFKLEPCEPKEWGQEGSWEWLIEQIETHGLANALLLTSMPSASTAQVFDNTEATEVYMQNVHTRKVMSGEYVVLNHHLVKDLKKINLWNKDTYNNIVKNDGSILFLSESGLNKKQAIELRSIKERYLTMWEIPTKVILMLAAQRQVFIDHSQSTNLYIKHPTPEKMMAIHIFSSKVLGLKTCMYYLRTRSSSQMMRIGKVEEDKNLAKIEKELDSIMNTDTSSKKSVKEEYDPDFVNLKSLVRAQQEKFQNKEEKIRDRAIKIALKEATNPKLTCSLDGSGDCISCQ